ncbi:MAG: GyrI-like domain-containing protein [Bdellovibrionales bacterium]
MIKTILLAIFASAVVFIVYMYQHLGWSNQVQVEEASLGPFYLLQKEHMGPYHKIVETIQLVEKLARDRNWPCPQTFGEFLDDPATMDEDRLRANAGCVLTVELKAEDLPAGIRLRERPSQPYVVARFSGAPSLGPLKVYPAARAYIDEHRLNADPTTVIEIYTVHGQNVETQYLFPLAPGP